MLMADDKLAVRSRASLPGRPPDDDLSHSYMPPERQTPDRRSAAVSFRGLGSPREISNGYAGSSLRIRLTALRRICYSG